MSFSINAWPIRCGPYFSFQYRSAFNIYTGVRFADLLNVDFDPASGMIRMLDLRALLPDTPDEVMQQVYADHGRKHEFQEQYGHLEIDDLRWEKFEEIAENLAQCTCYPEFRRFIEIRRGFSEEFAERGWSCVDVRPAVAAHWEKTKTWLTPPVFLSGTLLNQIPKYHLVEGHSRMAVLLGSLDQGLLPPNSKHQLWLGRIYP